MTSGLAYKCLLKHAQQDVELCFLSGNRCRANILVCQIDAKCRLVDITQRSELFLFLMIFSYDSFAILLVCQGMLDMHYWAAVFSVLLSMEQSGQESMSGDKGCRTASCYPDQGVRRLYLS